MSHYDKLGVGKNATPEEIKRAWKKKAKENHPDKGGETGKFQELVLAYNTLSDKEKRTRYDNTGEDGIEQDPRIVAIENLTSIFLIYVDKVEDIEHTDLFLLVRKHLDKGEEEWGKREQANLKRIVKYQKIINKLRKKTKGHNFLAAGLEHRIKAMMLEADIARKNRELSEAMRLLLKEFEYEVKEQKEHPRVYLPQNEQLLTQFLRGEWKDG